ncbi:FAD-binding dehydrogenase [Sphingomonas sp. 2R-10]|uniref:FAD-binding dehydrogenase n=1 Tax=Sphingomonas sp. 2R-10 TaxID=3045148 RepID=UPI000F7B3B91|nr:FAD-binding dehydrogenase [Sphingomonas sp. 2R-10]MDJ0276436.1 FAD-binding dehydrogenase [Sphingomonas sp. 2R-10]
MQDADVIVVGAGLAGLVAAAEAADAGRSVVIVDQEPEQNIGAQAVWSLGGLFFVDSPEQRRMGIRDSRDLAWQDWQGTAGFDRDEDHWPRRWAEAYVDFAAGEKRGWLRAMGHRVLPVVGWAERGGASASGPGNSVPRFHLTWGTGPGVVAPFERRVRDHAAAGRIGFRWRHKVERIMLTDGVATGIAGAVLEPSGVPRGGETSRVRTGDFELRAQAIIVASGGIGGNHDMVRANWPERLGPPPATMISGVPMHVDGSMIAVLEAAGGKLINRDRMWHYVEGLRNWSPVWNRHGIRILPGPSSMWFDATGKRFAAPDYPGNDTLSTLAAIGRTGHDYSWFVLNQTIIAKEFALSGSEQNPDVTGKNVRLLLRRALNVKRAPGPIEAFKRHGEDVVVADDLPTLVARMNALVGGDLVRLADIERELVARDREMDNAFGKDAQVMLMRNALRSRGDRLSRVAKPHKILDPAHGPLIAVRLNILTRKTLGGFQCDLDGRVFDRNDAIIPGLYAAGEVAGFGGGGLHGYRALEGTFLGGCLFSGRTAARAAAAAL